MSFVRNQVDVTPIEDTVFAIVKKAKAAIALYGDDKVINATIGSLFNEEGTIVAYDSVFHHYDEIKKEVKAAYAASFVGNESYRDQVYTWVCGNAEVKLSHSVIATPGGTGAVSLSFNEILDEGDCVILPSIAWGSYSLMASMHNLTIEKYDLFDGDCFNLTSFKETCLKVLGKQKKLLVVINDPCHNPTGYSLTIAEWEAIIEFLNECGKQAPVVILNDIAYIDYAYHAVTARKYLETMNKMSHNVMCIVAFSCSKTMTSYGLRCGAALILAQDKKSVREVEIVFEKSARALWSNISNSAMENFTYVTTVLKDEYLKEKDIYVDLLYKRSHLFLEEANKHNLACYPYKEGFFVTIKVEDNELRDRYHEALMDQLIFCVKVNKGIRVAICSLSIQKCKGLALKMAEILRSCS
ncbi:MAG: aminotransferase class I/II-fold pyridoxal phosphate-dependent enzyme [Erysipelotrichaceae bacterium]